MNFLKYAISELARVGRPGNAFWASQLEGSVAAMKTLWLKEYGDGIPMPIKFRREFRLAQTPKRSQEIIDQSIVQRVVDFFRAELNHHSEQELEQCIGNLDTQSICLMTKDTRAAMKIIDSYGCLGELLSAVVAGEFVCKYLLEWRDPFRGGFTFETTIQEECLGRLEDIQKILMGFKEAPSEFSYEQSGSFTVSRSELENISRNASLSSPRALQAGSCAADGAMSETQEKKFGWISCTAGIDKAVVEMGNRIVEEFKINPNKVFQLAAMAREIKSELGESCNVNDVYKNLRSYWKADGKFKKPPIKTRANQRELHAQ